MTTPETNHMSEDAARQSESVTADRCKHEELCFHSGGHYVYCPACRGWWVARKNAHTSDEDIDYDRSAKSDVIGGEVRVRCTPSQPAASGGVAELKAEIERLTDEVGAYAMALEQCRHHTPAQCAAQEEPALTPGDGNHAYPVNAHKR